MFVITADQVDSRRFHDRVPAALTLLARSPARAAGASRSFERTAGDEIQGVCEGAEEVLDIVTTLIRHGQWRIGIGIGPVDLPLPESPREGRGPAFVAARDAVQAAHPVPGCSTPGCCAHGPRRGGRSSTISRGASPRRTPPPSSGSPRQR